MNELPHLRLEGTEKPEPYTYAGPVPSGVTFERPARNPPAHAKKVRRELEQADADARRRRAEDVQAIPELVEWRPEGVVLTFQSDHDHYQHGTGMAGNAAYGCLTEVMQATGAIRLRRKLESAKILPRPPARNEPPDYGRRMQDGVALAHIKARDRKRVICMAVTADDYRDGGVPSLWSGAVDDMRRGSRWGAEVDVHLRRQHAR